MKGLVLTSAVGLKDENIGIFMRSLTAVDYRDPVIVFVNGNEDYDIPAYESNVRFVRSVPLADLSLATKRNIKRVAHRTGVHKFIESAVHGRMLQRKTVPVSLLQYIFTQYHLMTSRFLLYYNCLLRSDCQLCLIVDVSDVCFQAHPSSVRTLLE